MIKTIEINSALSIVILNLELFSKSQPNRSKRELEKLGSVFCLQEILKTNKVNLNYTEIGKPYLEGRTEQISISHSHQFLCVAINRDEITGIDVELIREKIHAIKHKFLSQEELLLSKDNTEILITFWSVKETLYKLHTAKDLSFINNLKIMEFDASKIIGKITTKQVEKAYLLNWKKIENYILVYAINEL